MAALDRFNCIVKHLYLAAANYGGFIFGPFGRFQISEDKI